MTRTLLAAAAAAVLLSSPAMAGGTRFDGPRVGIDFGLEQSQGHLAAPALKSDEAAIGALGGAFAGYGQTFGRYYLGAEASYDYSGAENLSSAYGASVHSGFDHTFALSGKAGYLIQPNLMAYGLVGWEHSRFGASVNGTEALQDWHDGVRFGAGAEYAFAPAMFARAEFDYTHYGRFAVGGGSYLSPDRSALKLGVGYSF